MKVEFLKIIEQKVTDKINNKKLNKSELPELLE